MDTNKLLDLQTLHEELRHRASELLQRCDFKCISVPFGWRLEHDQEFEGGRVFFQLFYYAPDAKGNGAKEWSGRKWYLSRHMTNDEIIKTAYAAFEACVKHEVMEGFKVDGKTLFNPHVNFEELLKVSSNEVYRFNPNQ